MTDDRQDQISGSVVARGWAMLVGWIRQLSRTPFFNRPEDPANAWQVIAWWESRRIPYNLLVGAVGIASCVLVFVTAVLTEHYVKEAFGLPNPPFIAIVAVIAYGVMANVCFTGGWIAEIAVRNIWPDEGKAFGKISFALGLVFSLALTLLPGILIATLGAIRLLEYALGW